MGGNIIFICHKEFEAVIMFYKMLLRRREQKSGESLVVKTIYIPAYSDKEAADFVHQLRIPEKRAGDRVEVIRPNGALLDLQAVREG